MARMQSLLGSGEVERAAKRGLLSAAMRGRALVVKETAKKGLVDTGRYRNAWKAQSVSNGAVLLNDAPYAAVIEGGRRPGARMPPRGPIEAWVHRKGIGIPAFVIQRAIARRGIKAKHILKNALPKIQKYVQADVRRSVRRSLASMMGGRP